ncbi:MAG: replicative DNA helicase [Patescibacteria group bacterium]
MPVKVPPHDLEAEVSVLGAILIDSEAIVTVSEKLKADAFYLDSHAQIYTAMLDLYEKREPIDAITLSSRLKKMRKLKAVGGASKIAELSNSVSTAANVAHYAKLVHSSGVKRKLISLSARIGSLAFDASQELQDIVDKVEEEVFSVSKEHAQRSFVGIKDVLTESFERIDELQHSGGGIRGVSTGFADIDHTLAGLQKSNLIILAARPGMGKTALALNMAHYAAVVAKKNVAFFSLEMSKEELIDRLLVSQADIDAWKLKTGRLDQQDFLKLSDAMGVLAEAKLFIDDTPGQTIFEMRTRARKLMSEQNIDMIVVDYLQLAHGRNKDNRVLEVGEISQGLKNIARELKVPVLALSQLSRAIESRGDKSPQLSDLRESGSIEQDADVVMFLYRKDDDIRESVNIKIAKHRNGALGDLELYFKGDRIKFYGMESRRQAA